MEPSVLGMGNMNDTLREHLARISHMTSPRKAAAARVNGKLGGRPKSSRNKPNMQGFAHIGPHNVQNDAPTE